MKTVVYTGPADFRIITKADFESIGVDDQEGIEVEVAKTREVEVSDAAAEWLKKNEQFKDPTPTRQAELDAKKAPPAKTATKK